LEYLNELVQEFDNWTEALSEQDFLRLNLKDQFAIYHALQLIIDIITDVIAMTVKDIKIKPKDDYSNIECLYQQGIISKDLREGLSKLKGLRNIIVHNYNGFDNRIAFKGMNEHYHFIKEFYKVIREWLRKRS